MDARVAVELLIPERLQGGKTVFNYIFVPACMSVRKNVVSNKLKSFLDGLVVQFLCQVLRGGWVAMGKHGLRTEISCGLAVAFSLDGFDVSIFRKPIMAKTSIFNKYWIIGVGIAVNHLLGFLTLLFYRDVSTPFFGGMVIAGFLQTLGPKSKRKTCPQPLLDRDHCWISPALGSSRLYGYIASSHISEFAWSFMLPFIGRNMTHTGTASWQGSIRW